MPIASSRFFAGQARPLFHDVERRALFRDEEDALALREGVGDHVGDRLALARPRGAVQHEGSPRARECNRVVLRAVGDERKQNFLGIPRVLIGLLRLAPLGSSRKKCRHVVVFFPCADVRAQVVPEQKPLEGEHGEVGVVHDVPPLHARRLGTHHGADLGDFQRGDVPAQPADIDIEFLLERFEQGGVDEVPLLARGEREVLVALRPRQPHGDEHDGRIARLPVLLGDILQKAEREIEDARPRLLRRLTVPAEEI